jgi:hypothetical protein
MNASIQHNFLFIWIAVLLGMALVLSLTLSGCSSGLRTNVPVDGKATNVLNDANGCVDSDGGINKDVKGEVTFNGNVTKDECVGPFLVEYYCDNGKPSNQNFKCDCSKGICNTNTTSS